jgi:phosphatidylglycerophosphate synthase
MPTAIGKDSFAGSAVSIAELRQRCQEHKWANSRGLTRLHRYVSIYVTALAIRTPVTANTLTVTSIATGLAASAIFAIAPDSGLAGVGLLYLSFLLDQVDGEVARYRNATSLGGSYLDELRHILIYAAPVFAVGLGLVTRGAHPLTAGVGFTSALCLILLRFNSNARYLLVAKKLLAAANGAVQTASSIPGARPPMAQSNVRRRHTGRKAIASVYSRAKYLLTNQVCLLGLLLVFHLAALRGSLALQGWIYGGYALALATLTIVDCAGMASVRIERSCRDLADDLTGRPDRTLARASND